MTFAKQEESVYFGRPIQLYQFLRSSGDTDYYWSYNTSDRDLWYNEVLYKAVPISDDGVRQTGEAAAAEYKVTMPITEQFCVDYRGGGAPPSDSIYLRMFRCHAADITDLDGDAPTVSLAQLLWVGTVDGLTQTNELTAEINCSTLSVSFKRGGLRYSWMKNCPHILYAPLTCKVDKELYRYDGTLTAIDSNVISADGWATLADGHFSGGFIEYNLPSGFLERRMIIAHAGTHLTILGAMSGLLVGDVVRAYAGCKRTVQDCREKFGNYENYGGFPHLPGRNPYDGKPIF